jgi:hypothetical protein
VSDEFAHGTRGALRCGMVADLLRSSNVISAAIFVALATAAPRASAQSRARDSTVLAVESGELVVDLGKEKGAHEGQVVELWRPVRVRHPLTGQWFTDRFKIGALRLTQVQTTLSLASVDGPLLRPPAAGDAVVLPDDPASKPTPAPAKVAAPPTVVVPADPDAQALSDLFIALRGATPHARADAYSSFAESHPTSRFASVLREEVEALTRHPESEPKPYRAASSAPVARLRPGVPQRFAVELDARFVGAVLHVRKRGAPTYRTVLMESEGPHYWGATVTGDAITAPGLEYFVEGVPSDGSAVPVLGNADAPRDTTVDAPPLTGKEQGTLAQLNVQSELATFNTKKANDYVFQTEGQFGWRLEDVGIRAVRSGFGVLRGKGGTLEQLDTLGQAGKAVGLTYGYVEGEIGLSTNYALIGRPIVGLREGGVTGGAQGFLRIGNDLRTNLLLGGEILGTVGMRGVVELNWRTIPRVPIMLRSEVTNQPAGMGGDLGARAVAQAGYELARDFTVSARGSYQGRTINHSGPGAGLGVSYQW